MIGTDVEVQHDGVRDTAFRDALDRDNQEIATPTLYVDAHVHLHPCFDMRVSLDAAWSHVERASRNPSANVIGVLLLAETTDREPLSALTRRDATLGNGWSIERCSDGLSIIARQADEPRLIIVAGRQVQTAERLEVLALLSNAVIPHGQPIEKTINDAREARAIVVLPWGVGKWWGKRGRIVNEVIAGSHAPHIFLGDNGGRPRWTPTPSLIRAARSKVRGVLPGSDPFPLPDEVANVGRYGFMLDAPIDLDRPASDLDRALCDLDAQPRRYGRRIGPVSFFRRQTAMWLRRRNAGAQTTAVTS